MNSMININNSPYEQVLGRLSDTVSMAVGEEFFDSLAQFLVREMGGDYAIIAELEDVDGKPVAHSLSLYSKEKKLPNICYDLVGTPCAEVVGEQDLCFYSSGVAKQFPTDTFLKDAAIESYVGAPIICFEGNICGLMLVLGCEPMEDSALIRHIFNMFSARVSGELDRRATQRKLEVFTRIIDQTSLSVLMTDPKGTIEYANKSLLTSSGFTLDEIIGTNPRLFKSGQHDQTFYADMWCQLLDKNEWTGEIINKHKNGQLYTEHASIVAIKNDTGNITNLVCFKEDISEQMLLAERQRLASGIIENSSQAIFITDQHNNIKLVNKAFTLITGYPASEVMGQQPFMLTSDLQGTGFYKGIYQTLAKQGQWNGEISSRHKDGQLYTEQLQLTRINDEQGNAEQYMGMFVDITEQKHREQLIYQRENFDFLTGLRNKDNFKTAVLPILNTLTSSVSLVFINLDNFKRINNVFGWETGDKLLTIVARRIESAAPTAHAICRLSSDEYVIAFADTTDQPQLEHTVNNILRAIGRPIAIASNEVTLKAYAGIATSSCEAREFEDLLQLAGAAMGVAQRQGGDGYHYVNEDIINEEKFKLQLEQDLRLAITEQQFVVAYQPIIDLHTGIIEAAEALIRWPHASRGMIAPAEFIPVAERSGLIIPIGKLVLEMICKELLRLDEEGLYLDHITYNLSAVQCMNGSAFDELVSVIKESGIDSSRLVMEITESMLLEDDIEITKRFELLKNMGIRLSLDDFGTGYSCLSYIRKFDIDFLKVDQSFVKEIESDPESESLVKAIHAMADSLNIKVVAEGIETDLSAAVIQSIGCCYGQGYHFSKPIFQEEFHRLIAPAKHHRCNSYPYLDDGCHQQLRFNAKGY